MYTLEFTYQYDGIVVATISTMYGPTKSVIEGFGLTEGQAVHDAFTGESQEDSE